MVAEQKTAYFDLFVEITKTITSNLDLDGVFELITTRIPGILDIDAASIRLLDDSRRNLKLRAAHGLSQEYLNRSTIDTEEPVFKALKGDPILIEDAEHDARIRYPEATKKEGIKTILVVPIPIRGEVSGILRLITKRPRTYQKGEIEFITLVAEQCGIAIENARIFKEQRTQLNYFKTIYEIGTMVNSNSDLDNLLNFIVTRLPKVMNQKAATIRLIKDNINKLELRAAYGLSKTYLERGPLDDELATYYLKKGEPVVILDAGKDPHTIYHKEAEAEGIGSILAVPISVHDEILGILRILTEKTTYFSEADINFAMVVAEQTGIAIQRSMV